MHRTLRDMARKTKEQLINAKKAREALTKILENIAVGESSVVKDMLLHNIKIRVTRYNKDRLVKKAFAYDETENGVTIFRRK